MRLFNRKELTRPELYGLPVVFTFEHLVNHVTNTGLVPSCNINGVLYEALSANSYIKLRTKKGLEYWVSQAEQGRRQPDWKLHFAIAEEDIGKAWNILARIFLEMRCDYIMKVKTHPAEEWPAHMRGREITVYVPMPSKLLRLTKKNVPNSRFWIKFIDTAEEELSAANILPRPTADGDLQIGRFTSIRNEAFILKTLDMNIPDEQWEGYDRRLEENNPRTKQYIYPPNESGYNAAKHAAPDFINLINAQRIRKTI